jgi:hybrid cluster-associated redox disulfide protein
MDAFNISPQMTIAYILEQWPETVPVFLKHHLACVGCSLNAYSTLEEGMRTYALPQENFLAELQQAAAAARPGGRA